MNLQNLFARTFYQHPHKSHLSLEISFSMGCSAQMKNVSGPTGWNFAEKSVWQRDEDYDFISTNHIDEFCFCM